MLNDFSKPDLRLEARHERAHYVTVNGEVFYLDADDGHYCWLNKVPECQWCSEELAQWNDAVPRGRVLVHVERSRRTGDLIIECPGCSHVYEVNQ